MMGPVPIADIGPGTMVLTKDDCGVVSFQPCERQILSENAPLLDLADEYEGGRVETIETTDEHPFWVLGSGWTRADQLIPGARVDALSGPATVRSLSFASRATTVYDLTVPVGHSFFVGTDGVWVHNCPIGNYRERFLTYIGRELPEGYQVHHRFPQKYHTLFPNGEVDDVVNMAGVKNTVHYDITEAWRNWGKLNPNPSVEDVKKAAATIDAQFISHYITR